MKIEDVTALADIELAQVALWVNAEQKTRMEKHKQETIARIREMAASIGVTLAIGGQRGRPAKAKPAANDSVRRATNNNAKPVEEAKGRG